MLLLVNCETVFGDNNGGQEEQQWQQSRIDTWSTALYYFLNHPLLPLIPVNKVTISSAAFLGCQHITTTEGDTCTTYQHTLWSSRCHLLRSEKNNSRWRFIGKKKGERIKRDRRRPRSNLPVIPQWSSGSGSCSSEQ